MPMKKKKQGYNRVVVYDSSRRDSDSVKNDADKDSSEEKVNPEDTDLRAEIGREIENLRNQTPMLTPPIGCSTEIATDVTARPIGHPDRRPECSHHYHRGT